MTEYGQPPASRFLTGAHAIITGGGHGLGASVAAGLASAGASVTVMGRDSARLDTAAADISQRCGVSVRAIVCDVSDPESVAAAFPAAVDAFGPATILVNNAGQALAASFSSTSLESWRRTMDVNLTGPFLCARQVIASMINGGTGRIVNIASTAALRGYATLSAYCASKHGLLGLTRSLAAEVAQHGITVNAVCPGYTEGGMSDQAIEAIMGLRNVSSEEALAMLVRRSPRRQLTTQEEVAATVTWLCSAGAAAITGQAIAVAGGEVM
jgi:3-hydroxybutyrate dehydrogenase